jgi:hypothetical protein
MTTNVGQIKVLQYASVCFKIMSLCSIGEAKESDTPPKLIPGTSCIELTVSRRVTAKPSC